MGHLKIACYEFLGTVFSTHISNFLFIPESIEFTPTYLLFTVFVQQIHRSVLNGGWISEWLGGVEEWVEARWRGRDLGHKHTFAAISTCCWVRDHSKINPGQKNLSLSYQNPSWRSPTSWPPTNGITAPLALSIGSAGECLLTFSACLTQNGLSCFPNFSRIEILPISCIILHGYFTW